MSQQDFINKKRPSKKQAPVKKKLPIGLILLAVLLVSGLAYGLWYISNHQPAPTPGVNAKKTVTKPVEPKPQPPKFIEEIKQHEVQVEVKEQEQKGPYALICGSFKTDERAQSQKAIIAFEGITSEVRQSKNGYYQVRLGPYSTKRIAESEKNKLKRANAARCNIINWS
ncbi:SPOR domain-containing protein [Pseudoalteromonas tunicata]|jgi:cell division protein FtsN|uniref:SPOR domain-containing protein n=1 Tax=Pseudoalteromonas tunicata D2 TaxID=87626 RepID=A4C8F7_9GAMM|nr:SPOR domain-containing protein [Pseudoalteromonas tunicata]ATC93376.1 hypothetical protein PTUN_a0606 [Pseudoalteromonas tunicata]AXT32423.1 SPOR domain-containing protein [Pseudoalteromonas tunicata]EAR28872.1 hypothetical protein PTD2_07509 [Pseudoalteromonas tunicata D2]MDP4983294.1 SPOR domain-containing protein [Pseudoalteromonas tunicata]MDP5213554.1 SPOR domain-containing protein [Pseudoalteromonas tunicata]